MSETALTVITDSLQLLVALRDEASIPAAEAQVAIRFLNRMMASLESDGIDLNYTPIDSLDDTITVVDGAIEPIVYMLAVKLAPEYKKTLGGEVLASAVHGRKTLLNIALTLTETEYPDTLPSGSGNNDSNSDDPFYPGA